MQCGVFVSCITRDTAPIRLTYRQNAHNNNNNNQAFKSQASWGRLEMKSINPTYKDKPKEIKKQINMRKEKRGKDQQKTKIEG